MRLAEKRSMAWSSRKDCTTCLVCIENYAGASAFEHYQEKLVALTAV